MATVRALIVDDERLARLGVRRELDKYPAVEVVGECANGMEAVRAIETLRPGLVFLDIQMPGLDGFGVVHRIGVRRMPAVVFVTAFDQYAIRAFEIHAFDYLLKPIDPDRLRETVDHALARLRAPRDAAIERRLAALLARIEHEGKRPADERIVVRERDRIFFVTAAQQVVWLEAAGNYVRVHLDDARHLVRSTMDRMEARLDASGFVRVRRSALVNLAAVREIRPYVKGTYVFAMRNGARVVSSRGYRSRVESLIDSGR